MTGSDAHLRRVFTLLVLVAGLGRGGLATADDRPSAELEFRRATGEANAPLTAWSGAWFLRGEGTIGRQQVRVDLPWSVLARDDGDDVDLTVGNPYLGLVVRDDDSALTFDVGLRVPLADPDERPTLTPGLRATLLDDIGAFVPDVVHLALQMRDEHEAPRDLTLRVRLGVDWLASTTGGDAELFVRPAVGLAHTSRHLVVGADLRANWQASLEDVSLLDATIQDLRLAVARRDGTWRPRASVAIALDDALDAVADLVVGFAVTWVP